MEKLKRPKVLFALILLAILGLAFYWYEWRPNEIRKDCATHARQDASGLGAPTRELRKDLYGFCILEQGLEE